MISALTGGLARSSASNASAGGQDEQPSLVNSSTTTAAVVGASSAAACANAECNAQTQKIRTKSARAMVTHPGRGLLPTVERSKVQIGTLTRNGAPECDCPRLAPGDLLSGPCR